MRLISGNVCNSPHSSKRLDRNHEILFAHIRTSPNMWSFRTSTWHEENTLFRFVYSFRYIPMYTFYCTIAKPIHRTLCGIFTFVPRIPTAGVVWRPYNRHVYTLSHFPFFSLRSSRLCSASCSCGMFFPVSFRIENQTWIQRRVRLSSGHSSWLPRHEFCVRFERTSGG